MVVRPSRLPKGGARGQAGRPHHKPSEEREKIDAMVIMTDVLRQEIAALATTLVVKIGTQVLTGDDGQLNQARIGQLARQLHDVVSSGRKVVLVSSGAVGPGDGTPGHGPAPTDLPRLQSVAAIGQSTPVEAD